MLDYMTGWFSANGLALNKEKTNRMKFTSSYHHNEAFQIIYQNKIITGTDNTKCLGLELDKNIRWKNHVQKIIPKLSSACYLVRRMYPCCNSNTLKMIYFAYFHTIMEYGIIFWAVSVESKRIFQQQQRIIRIMTVSTSRISCRTFFWKLEILTLTSQYILSSMRFLSSNLEIFIFNTSIHNINTRLKLKLHKPTARLTMYQRNAYYNSINIYNKLPDDLAELVLNKKRFPIQLKKYLTEKPFYSLEAPFSVTVSIFTVSAFTILKLTPSNPILLTAIPPHIIISPIHCIAYTALLNPLKTKDKVLYLKTQSVPRCKHFSSQL